MLRRTTIRNVATAIKQKSASRSSVLFPKLISKSVLSSKQQQINSFSSSSFTYYSHPSTIQNILKSNFNSLKVSILSQRRYITTEPSNLTKPVNNISSVFGPTTPPLDERTLGEFWNDLIASYPTSPALVCRHENRDIHSTEYRGGIWKEEDCLRYNFREMGEKVDQLARGMMSLGFKKGDRVGAYLGNGSAYALLQWATAKVGIILVCINPASRGPELIAALNLSGCSALFIPPSLKKSAHIPMLHTLLPSLSSTSSTSTQDGQVCELSDPACPSLKRILMVDNTELGARGFAELLESEGLGGMDARCVLAYEPMKGQAPIEFEKCYNTEVQNIQFSSGTTGLPKAIPLTSRNLLNNGRLIGDYMNLRPPAPKEGWFGERLCNVPPMYHCFGIVLGNLAFWTHGGCIIFAAEVFSPALTLRAVVQEKCTALHGVPTMFTAELALLDQLDEGKFVEGLSDLGEMDFSSMRTGIAAGSPVPAELAQKFAKRMNLNECVIVYGQTETSPGTVMSQTGDSMDLRCRTVGQVMPHTHIRIVDPLHPLYPSEVTPSIAVGMPGEIWSGGYALQPGYWNNQLETDKAMFTDSNDVRWMRTGDQASMDEDGFITITGRIKDIIIRGGENLFPTVIEARSLLLNGVSAVSIIAVPCPKFGEVVGAFVERSLSPSGASLKGEDLTNHITEIMSHQSAPSWVWFLGEEGIEEEFPKTASGKVRKVELREWAKGLVEREVGRTKIA